ncbi:unnamed protein product [Prunus armeniaca]|uniref:Uncharacterized protein n=1 Tax=Prunus armeniaca TaxID=36596 RepID=A0A6J5WG37_PRUAR|nr:unnamed protein product [Prunus armeniaca]
MEDDDNDATPKSESSPSQSQLPPSQASLAQKMHWADYPDSQDPYDLNSDEVKKLPTVIIQIP